jgi:hypothetical protein
MRLPGKLRGPCNRQPIPFGDFVVPGVTLLVLARQTLGISMGRAHRIRRIRRVIHQEFRTELHHFDDIQVEYDLIDDHGYSRELACRFLDRHGTLLASVDLEVDFLS